MCECKALASLSYIYLGSFFLDLRDVKSLSLGAIRNFSKGKGLPWPGIRLRGTKGPSEGLGASELKGLKPNNYTSIFNYDTYPTHLGCLIIGTVT